MASSRASTRSGARSSPPSSTSVVLPVRVSDDQQQRTSRSGAATSGSDESAIVKREPTDDYGDQFQLSGRLSDDQMNYLKWTTHSLSPDTEPNAFIAMVFKMLTDRWYRFNKLYYFLYKGSSETRISSEYEKPAFVLKNAMYSELPSKMTKFGALSAENRINALRGKGLKLFSQTKLEIAESSVKLDLAPFQKFSYDSVYYDSVAETIKFSLNPEWYNNLEAVFRQKPLEMLRAFIYGIVTWVETVLAYSQTQTIFEREFKRYAFQDNPDAQLLRKLHNQFIANLELYPDLFASLAAYAASYKKVANVPLAFSILAAFLKNFDEYYVLVFDAFDAAKSAYNPMARGAVSRSASGVFDTAGAQTSTAPTVAMVNGAPKGFHEDKVLISELAVRFTNEAIAAAPTQISEESLQILNAELDKVINEIERFASDRSMTSRTDPPFSVLQLPRASKLEKVIIYLVVWAVQPKMLDDFGRYFANVREPNASQIFKYLVDKTYALFLNPADKINQNYALAIGSPRYEVTELARQRALLCLQGLEYRATLAAAPKTAAK